MLSLDSCDSEEWHAKQCVCIYSRMQIGLEGGRLHTRIYESEGLEAKGMALGTDGHER